MSQKINSAITVDLAALKVNVSTLKSFLNKGTQVMAVVKANAYGHGAVKVAEALSSAVDAFAVNDILEGIELRERGIRKPVLIFGVPEKPLAEKYKKYDLTATISHEDHFNILPEGTSYHLNFDTGMGRLGFRPKDAKKVARLATKHHGLSCRGIYSHFATADRPHSDLVSKQYGLFQRVLKYFPNGITAHVCNTGGTVFYEFNRFDMVRLGIGMYGYSPGKVKIEGLRPILKWSTRLVQVKKVEVGTTISYGANWKAPADGYLGVIPVGYYDGVSRNLTGKGSVRISGKDYEIVGTIAMNFCMVYLGDDFYEAGTEVELIHPENNAEDWAEKLNTISYEVLTGLDTRIPRKYVG